jgi:hypothetical protein|nr:MAG TPA_asm: hypothetical protein [Caudoviricetes sp.]
MPKSKVFLSKSERKSMSKAIKSRPRQANGRFVSAKNKPVLVLDDSAQARKVEMIKAADELDKTPSWLYFLFAFLFLVLFGLVIFYEI